MVGAPKEEKAGRRMNFAQARASGRPFKWNNWATWYRWDAAAGCLAPINGGEKILTLPVHLFEGDLWQIDPLPVDILWFRATLMWHRDGQYYRNGVNWYSSEASMRNAYETTYDIVAFDQAKMPKEYRK